MYKLGKTKNQIESSPRWSVYVACNDKHKVYCENLAYSLGRFDIRFIKAGDLTADIVKEYTLNRVIADHAVMFKDSELMLLNGYEYD